MPSSHCGEEENQKWTAGEVWVQVGVLWFKCWGRIRFPDRSKKWRIIGAIQRCHRSPWRKTAGKSIYYEKEAPSLVILTLVSITAYFNLTWLDSITSAFTTSYDLDHDLVMLYHNSVYNNHCNVIMSVLLHYYSLWLCSCLHFIVSKEGL